MLPSGWAPQQNYCTFHWIESYLTFKQAGLDGQCCQLYNHVSFYHPNVYAVLLLEFMIFSKAMYSATCTFKSDPCHAAILVCSLIISVSSHFHSISMSYNFSLELCFSFFRQFTKSSRWRTPLSAWSTFHGRLNPWMRTQYCLEMIKVRQTILLILSTIFENTAEVISLCSLELELDHVNPLHPYIHNYVYSPYWFLVYIS